MKNRYEVRGYSTAIYLKKRNGAVLETLVDTSFLPNLLALPLRWFATAYGGGRIYARAKCQGRTIRLHRLVAGDLPNLVIDHINHDTLDNRLSNLRVVSQTSNGLNRIRANRDNKSSGIRGVHWDARCRKWKARIKKHGRSYHLGLFLDKFEAAKAVEAKLRELGEIVHVALPS